MRVLALDYGQARCGCAVSDPTGEIARPLAPVERPADDEGLRSISDLVEQLGAQVVVVGMPVGLSGSEGAQARETREFVRTLRERLPVEVDTYDERFTSKLARHTLDHTRQQGAPAAAGEHSIAAAHILASYLESRR